MRYTKSKDDFEESNIYCFLPRHYEEDIWIPFDKDFWEKSIKAAAKIYKNNFRIDPEKDRAAVVYEYAYLAAPRFYEEVFKYLGIPVVNISFAIKTLDWIIEFLSQLSITVIQTEPLFALQLSHALINGSQPKTPKIKLICSSARKARGFSMPISQKGKEKIKKNFDLYVYTGATDFLLIGYNDGSRNIDEIKLMKIPGVISFETQDDPSFGFKRLLVNSENKAYGLRNHSTGDLVEVVEQKNEVPVVVKFKGREEKVVKDIYDWQIRKVLDDFRDKVVGNYEIERAWIYERKTEETKLRFTLRIPMWEEIVEDNNKLKELEKKIHRKWSEISKSTQLSKQIPKIKFESIKEYYSLRTEKILPLIEKTILGKEEFKNLEEVMDRLINAILILGYRKIIPENVKVIAPLLWTFIKDIRKGGWESDEVRDIFFSEDVMDEYKKYVNKISKENISVADILFTELVDKYNPLIGIKIFFDKEDNGNKIFWEEKEPERFLKFRIGKESHDSSEKTLDDCLNLSDPLKENLKKLAPIFAEYFDKLRCFYYFPTSLIWEGKELKGFGGMVLCCDKAFQNEEEKIKEIHLYNQTMWSYFSIWEWARKSNVLNLTNAAIAIMIRNFSHNIGSHVVSRSKGEFKKWINRLPIDITLKNIKDAVKNGAFEEYCLPKPFDYALLLNYIETRFDFIANVVSPWSILWGKGFFEEGIYWQGKIEEKWELSTDCRFKSNIISDFVSSPVIQKLIEASEDKIKKISITLTSDLNKKMFALPYGYFVGRHAFYSILENYIRNVSKYGVLKNGKLDIILNKMDEDDNSVRLNLSSSSVLVEPKEEKTKPRINELQRQSKKDSKINNYLKASQEKRKEFLLGLKNKLPNNKFLKQLENDGSNWEKIDKELNKTLLKINVEKIYEALSDNLLTPEGAISPKGWGHKEMKVCASLLRGLPFHLIDDEEHREELLWFDKAENDPSKDIYSNQYSFCFSLRKYIPKQSMKKEELERYVNTLKGKADNPWAITSIIDFLIIESSMDYLKENWEWLPPRIAIVGKEEGDEWIKRRVIFIDNKDVNFKYLTERWIDKFCKNNLIERIKVMGFWSGYNTQEKNDSKKEIKFGNDNGIKIGFYHANEAEINQKELRKIQYSHQGLMSLIFQKLKQEEESAEQEWLVILGSKVILIDDRLYEQAENKIKKLKDINVWIFPEKGIKEVSNVHEIIIKYKNETQSLSDKLILSIHLSYLQEKDNSLILKEENVRKLPPFIFVHTGRGKAGEEKRMEYWLRKITPVSNLEMALASEYPLEIKIRLIDIFLSG